MAWFNSPIRRGFFFAYPNSSNGFIGVDDVQVNGLFLLLWVWRRRRLICAGFCLFDAESTSST